MSLCRVTSPPVLVFCGSRSPRNGGLPFYIHTARPDRGVMSDLTWGFWVYRLRIGAKESYTETHTSDTLWRAILLYHGHPGLG